MNASDVIDEFASNTFENVIEANVNFLLQSMKIPSESDELEIVAPLVVLSGTWGYIIRLEKLSYGRSNAAICGLVRSIADDLGQFGFQFSSVSP
jgi:NAD(P)-dependent dehydrogenase (short-subunit alcohol dehydrogenase family)